MRADEAEDILSDSFPGDFLDQQSRPNFNDDSALWEFHSDESSENLDV